MKNVLVSIKNELLSTAVTRALKDCGEFLPRRISSETDTDHSDRLNVTEADILLMEVSYLPGATLETRLNEIRQIRRIRPECKIVAFCDDTASPELAHKVTQLKKDHFIDSFLYTSVTASYLISTLASL